MPPYARKYGSEIECTRVVGNFFAMIFRTAQSSALSSVTLSACQTLMVRRARLLLGATLFSAVKTGFSATLQLVREWRNLPKPALGYS